MYQTIDHTTLKRKLDTNRDLHLVEVLSEKEFNRLHIPGAEHINFNKIGKAAKERFSQDDEIVVYCADTECKASPMAAEKFDTFGFTHVYDFVEGKKGWSDAGYPMEGREAVQS